MVSVNEAERLNALWGADLGKAEGVLADLRRLLERDPYIAARIETLTLAGAGEYLARARVALADLPRLQREAGRLP